jgi:8-oxo-dGTP diphosphatase
MSPIERVSSGGLVLDKKNNVLLIYRRSTGEYLIPNGEVMPGETLEQTAVREILEETGYKTKVIKKIDMSEYTYIWEDGKVYHKKEHHFLLELEEQKKRRTKREPHEDYTNKWVSLDQAETLLTYKDSKQCLKNLKSLLKEFNFTPQR